jgi:Skp family chaperone for outer membrane proteins
MRRFDRILLCLLTAGVCTIAAHQTLQPRIASAFPIDETAQRADHKIAVCAVNKVIRELLESDRFLPARAAIKLDEIIEEFTRLEQEFKQLQQQWEQAQRGGGGDLDQIQQRGTQVAARMEELEQTGQQLERQLQQLTIRQLKEAYELARSAAEAVAEDLGYDYVVSTQRTEDEFNLNPASLPAEFNARPMLVYPDGVDITADVLAELNLG